MSVFLQLLVGTVLISGTVLIQAVFIAISIAAQHKFGSWWVKPPVMVKGVVVKVALVLWLVAGLSISAWLWAGVYLWTGVIDSLEAALYFSTVTFTTLGYGDITLDDDWRLMASLSAVNGVIIIGLNTAYLVEAISRLRKAQLGENGTIKSHL